eukprot:4432300-Amphidinium_carterae.1
MDVGSNGTATCIENMAFVAIHFDSHCESFCHQAFCITDTAGEQLCPANESTPPCEVSDTEAELMRCHVNSHKGECGSNSNHNISNFRENPLSDCWCACPRTQILKYYKSQTAKGEKDSLPRRPSQPKVVRVSGHDSVEQLPNQQVMYLHLDINHTDGADFYR